MSDGAWTTPINELQRKASISDATIYIFGRLSRRKRFERVPGGIGWQHPSGVTRNAGAPKRFICATPALKTGLLRRLITTSQVPHARITSAGTLH